LSSSPLTGPLWLIGLALSIIAVCLVWQRIDELFRPKETDIATMPVQVSHPTPSSAHKASASPERLQPVRTVFVSRSPAVQPAERTAVNTPIQGTAADLVKRAMLKVDAALRGKYQARMLLQVHDELVLEAPPAEVADVGRIVKDQMSSAADLAVPLVVELGSGDTWATAH